MTPERWQQIEEIFQDALDLPVSKRKKFVAEKCGEDSELKSEVEKLLSQFDDASSFIETPAYNDSQAGVLSKLMDFDEDDPMLGVVLGSYRIEGEIGRGGMGAVYEAVRADGEFRRKVAIKIVKRGMDTDFILRRFRNERQILATLEHPYITRLLDGGTTNDGRPYFVMDYIEGLPLYRYCDNNRLTIAERLKLFAKICEAVEYAHQNLVIHRDLKPSNILVSADGTPRLLDFGIAKLLNPEMASDTLQPTATAMRMMTIDYASPEQINGEKVTFATDIYSLGVILFELLTGHRPYRFRNRTPHEMARVICEEPPSLPSYAIVRSENTLPVVHADEEAVTIGHLAELRNESPDSLQEELKGNLDNITVKALNKLPEQRYESVKKFRRDIEKHLQGKPVSAPIHLPVNKSEIAQPQQNGRLIAVLPLKLLNASAAENTDENYLSLGLADAIISRLASIRDFTVRPTSSILGYEKTDVNPLQAGRELGVDFVLDGRIKHSGKKLRVSLQMLDIRNGSTLWAGQFDEKFSDVLTLEDKISEQVAEALVTQITGENKVKLGRRGTDNAEAYQAYLRGRYFWNQFTPETFPKALEAFEKAVQLDPNYALAHVGIADYYNWATIFGIYTPLDGYQKTREAAIRALEINPQLSEAISVLAFITAFTDYNWVEGEKLFKQSLDLNPNYNLTHEWYAALLAGTGRDEEAYTEILRSQELDPLSLRTVTLTAWTLYQLRRYPEALARVEELLEMNPNYYQGFFQRGNILREMGRAEEAVAAGRKGMMLAPGLGYMHYKLCFALVSLKRYEEAWDVLREYEENSPVSEINSYHLGMCYAAVGERETAFRWLNKAVDDRHPWVVWLATDAKLDDLRDDERFNELLRKTNRPHLVKEIAVTPQTLAVLPFKLSSLDAESDTEEKFLGLGLTDALITRLSKSPQLIVRPASSVLRFSESVDVFEAGKELAVKFVLDGNIRRVGERVRISVQLLDIGQNSTRWAENFDEKFTDILELEDSISEQVSKALLPHLTTDEQRKLARRETNNAEAYEAFLKGRFYWSLQSEEGITRSIQYYQQAVELDPNYAQAHAAIAEYYIFLGIHCIIPFAEGSVAARQAAEKAVQLDPTSAESYAALAFAVLCYDLDWTKSEELFEHALKLNPNSFTANFWYVAILAHLRRFDEALAQLRRVLELDPASLLGAHQVAWILYHARRYEESLAAHEKLLETEPNYAWGLQTYSWVLRRLGRFQEAVKQAERAVQLTGENPFYLASLAMAYADAGNRKEAEKLLRRLNKISKTRFVSEYMLALVYCALGDKEKAFAYLEKSVETKDAWTNWLGVEPQFDILRNDARFENLLRRTRNPLTKSKSSDSQSVKSIAVLPFKLFGTPTDSSDGEYLGIGLTDALINRLSKAKQLIVRPTSSVLRFEEITDAFRAGRELEVNYVLNGNIRRIGERLRVSMQLLNVEQNSTEWAENFDQKAADILELEDSISEQVVKSLIPQLTANEQRKLARRETDNPNAYEAYLKGRFYWNQFTPESLTKAFESFQEAVKLDPNYALAYVGLADYYDWAGIYGLFPIKPAIAEVERYARKAIELDENLGEAYATLALVFHHRKQWTEAEKLKLKAIELAPNYHLAHEWYAAQLRGLGRDAEATREILIAEQLDPLSRRTKTQVAWNFYQGRKFEEALKRGREIIELDKNYPTGYMQIAVALWGMKRFDEALPHFRKFNELVPDSGLTMYPLCFGLVKAGQVEEAGQVLEKFKSQDSYIKPYFLAMMHTALGEFDKAFGYFEQAFDEDDPWMIWFGTDPMLEEIRSDVRYIDILRRMNNPLAKKYSSEEKPISTGELPKSVAVLPLKLFATPTGSSEDEYLGIGLTDALITRLSNVGRLIVRPTTSVLPFQNQPTGPFSAGRSLQVEYVVDGNIRRVGERVRVSLQLLNVANRSTVWAEKFDEKFTDVLELEDVISERVVKSLLPRLTGEEQRRLEKRGTNNVEAYQAYLRGRYFANQFSGESLLKSIECYREAIQLDVNYALPHVGIADFYVWSAVFGEMPCHEAYPKAKVEIERALKIDDSLGEAFAIKAFITLLYDWDWAEAERLVKCSLELNPNFGFAHECYSNFFSTQGIVDEAVREIKRAEELDPLSPRAKLMTAWTYYVTRRFPEAIAKAGEANNMQTDFAQGLLHLGYAQTSGGEFKEAVKNLRHATESWAGGGMPKFMLCFALAADKKHDEAREVLAEIKNLGKNGHLKPYFLAMAYAAVGENDLAFEWFEKSVEARDEWIIWFGVDAKLDELRKDARYLQILRQTNNPIAARQFEVKTAQTSKSIAVLPLQFIGEAQKDDAYLSVGLADAMITRLSQVRRLVVRPTNSVLRFANSTDSFAAGRELGVDYVLNGVIRPAGSRIRISAQLLEIKTNSTIWSEKFDEEFTEVLELEDLVAEKVAKLLIPKLTREEERNLAKRSAKNVKAYEAYMRGRFHWLSYTVDGIAKAFYCYHEAIAEDENFALAYSGIADYYNFLSIFGVMSPEESFPAAKQAAEKAISLDKNLAEAYTSLGITAYGYDWDFVKAKKLLEKSLKLNPNSSEAHLWYGYIFALFGDHNRAIEEFEIGESLNPQSPSVLVSFALTLRNARQYERGLEKLRKALEIQPDNPTALQGFSWFVNALGNFDETEAMCKKAVEVSERQNLPLYAYGYTLASAGKRNEALKIIEELKERSLKQYVPPIYLALIYTALGETEAAFEWLEKCFEVHDFWVIWLPVDPRFDALRGDKRFKEFCQKIQPLPQTDETIHQSQIPTKIFTADELKGTKPEEKKEETPAKPTFFYRHKYKFAAAAIFLILTFTAWATGILTVDFNDRRVGVETLNPNKKRSVAILPFKNETANPENDFLCDGLSDNLIARLSYSPEIQVVPRSTSFKYKSSQLTPQQAGAEMNVETVLTGKLIKHDKEIEIAVELIDVKSGSRLWGFDYRGNDSDLVFLQNKMFGDVGEKFNLNNSKQVPGKSFTQNPEAFEFYLKGEYHRQKATPDDTRKSIEFYKKALETDPNYALAFQGLALAYRLAPAYGTHSPQEAYPLAKEAAMKALAIDPTLGSAHVPLASIRYVWDWDFAGAESEYKQAIQLVPSNSEAHYSYGNFLVAMGRTDEALKELRIAQQFEPLSPMIASNIGWALYIAGRFDEAEAQIKQLLAREPNFARGYTVLGEIYQEQGKFDESIAAFQKSKQISNDPISEMALGHVYATAGRKAEAQKIAAELEAKVMKKEVSPFLPAVVYAGLHENDKAFYWLERAFQERSNWLTLIKVGRRMKPLHNDPRFDDLLKRIGFDK